MYIFCKHLLIFLELKKTCPFGSSKPNRDLVGDMFIIVVSTVAFNVKVRLNATLEDVVCSMDNGESTAASEEENS